jgi:hypothetical protein
MVDAIGGRPPSNARRGAKQGKQAPPSSSALHSPPCTSIEIQHPNLG